MNAVRIRKRYLLRLGRILLHAYRWVRTGDRNHWLEVEHNYYTLGFLESR